MSEQSQYTPYHRDSETDVTHSDLALNSWGDVLPKEVYESYRQKYSKATIDEMQRLDDLAENATSEDIIRFVKVFDEHESERIDREYEIKCQHLAEEREKDFYNDGLIFFKKYKVKSVHWLIHSILILGIVRSTALWYWFGSRHFIELAVLFSIGLIVSFQYEIFPVSRDH